LAGIAWLLPIRLQTTCIGNDPARSSSKTMVGRGDYSKKAEIIDQLVQGIDDRPSVGVTYKSPEASEAVTCLSASGQGPLERAIVRWCLAMGYEARTLSAAEKRGPIEA